MIAVAGRAERVLLDTSAFINFAEGGALFQLAGYLGERAAITLDVDLELRRNAGRAVPRSEDARHAQVARRASRSRSRQSCSPTPRHCAGCTPAPEPTSGRTAGRSRRLCSPDKLGDARCDHGRRARQAAMPNSRPSLVCRPRSWQPRWSPRACSTTKPGCVCSRSRHQTASAGPSSTTRSSERDRRWVEPCGSRKSPTR